MGIVTKTVTVCTCDLCGNQCDPADGNIEIQVDSGDGRDVGPGFIHASLRAHLPYRTDRGIVCAVCKMRWLRKYVTNQGAA